MNQLPFKIVVLSVLQRFGKELQRERSPKPAFEIDIKEIKVGSIIAEGANGFLKKAEWRGIKVAVKFIKSNQLTEDVIKEFLSTFKRRMLFNEQPSASQYSRVLWGMYS